MVQPLGVVSTVRALVLALVSPMLLQATLQASGMPVILERVSAMSSFAAKVVLPRMTW